MICTRCLLAFSLGFFFWEATNILSIPSAIAVKPLAEVNVKATVEVGYINLSLVEEMELGSNIVIEDKTLEATLELKPNGTLGELYNVYGVEGIFNEALIEILGRQDAIVGIEFLVSDTTESDGVSFEIGPLSMSTAGELQESTRVPFYSTSTREAELLDETEEDTVVYATLGANGKAYLHLGGIVTVEANAKANTYNTIANVIANVLVRVVYD